MFEVQGDATRPFLVKAGDTEVTAIGTRFDVRRTGAGRDCSGRGAGRRVRAAVAAR